MEETLRSLPPAADSFDHVAFFTAAPTEMPSSPRCPRSRNEWSATSTNLLFMVPETLRSVNPEAYLPRIFHFGPYAPKFFHAVLHSTPPPDSANSKDPISGIRFKEIMVEDLVGAAMSEALEKKISASYASAETFRNMYPERPLLMDTIPLEKIARLFASSAAIIVGSFIFYGSCDDMEVRRIGSQSPIVRHPVVYRYYAIMDAIIAMDNQIPILLLKLACEALNEIKCPLFAVEFDEGHELLKLFRDVDKTDMARQIHATRLLVYILRRSLKFVSPFHVAHSMWEWQDLRWTLSWIERNPQKPLMAYIYDSLVGPLAGRNGEETASNTARNDMFGSTRPDEHDSWGWPSPCRMVSASQLRSWGVKFRAVTSGCFMGISFDVKTTTLILPVITLQDTTMPFLCNLMAYELTTILEAESNLQHVASYVLFLDYLIDTKEDVQVLAEAGVLRSYMARSNAGIAKMLDGLVEGMIVDLTPEHSRIVKQLQKACRRRWGRWWASFKETYWEKQPWLLISVAAATVLLVLTVLQTVYAMRQG